MTLSAPVSAPSTFCCMSLLRNEAEAEDAAQETAIKVYLNLQNFPRRLAVPDLGAVHRSQ